jgi:tRNA A-37 threonylcarbamoyl transferase component Bud32
MEALKQCPACSRQVPRDARYCPLCGESIRTPRIAIAAGTGLLPPNHCLHDRYVVERRLAQGGQSAVYLAMDIAADNAARAIKEMSQAHLLPHERERAVNHFLREAQLLQQLDHPMLAKVYESFLEDDKHYLAMEYVPGKTLEDEMIELGRPLEWEPVVRWGMLLCDVLGYLHTQNPPIVYRDLKPANVMLTTSGTLKLIDFGIARRLIPARMRDTAQLGTDGYAPLEQYASKSEPRSDLYALGASLYHLLTGRVPENAPVRSSGGALTPIRTISPRVPETVERVVVQALSLHPDDRFPDAGAMREALSRLIPHEPPMARQTSAAAIPGATPGATPTGRMSGRTGAVIPPKLHVWPLRLDGGELAAGASTELELEIANRGGGELSGHVESSSLSVLVNPGRIDGATTSLRVRIDPDAAAPGTHSCHLALRTNGGVQTIPVRFTIPAPAGARHARSPT